MALTHDQKAFWTTNSYLLFRGLFGDRAQQLSRWVEEVAQWPDDFTQWLKFYEMDDPTKLSRIENFLPYHAGLADLLLAGPLA